MTYFKKPSRRQAALVSVDKDRIAAARKFVIVMMTSLLMIAAFALMQAPAFGQQDQTPQSGPIGGNVPGDSRGIASDSDLWRALKSGETGTVSDRNPAAAPSIQTRGMDWLRFRSENFATYSAWGIVGMIALLALFFAVRGRIRIGHGGPSGEKISRFKFVERLGHWLLASSFIILALTGLNLVFGREVIIPLLGKEAFATLTVYGKLAHNYIAFPFMVSLVWVAITWIWYNIPHPRDLVWFARGGGILGGGHPPAKKFNAGQKIIFWLVILGGVSLSLSGWTLLFPFTTHHFADTFQAINSVFGTGLPTTFTIIEEQQLAVSWHGIVSVFMICVVIAHIYIGSVGMEGAFAAMSTGEVDRTWAKEHHSLWVEEEDAKSSRSSRPETVQPAE